MTKKMTKKKKQKRRAVQEININELHFSLNPLTTYGKAATKEGNSKGSTARWQITRDQRS
jgi:hypothetical protein